MNYLRKMEWIHLEQVERKTNKKNRFDFLHILIPIAFGGIIYYLISPDVIFVKIMDSLLKFNIHITEMNMDSLTLRFIRNYFLDMLWGYALVFSLFFINDNNTARIKGILVIAFGFSTIIEILQVTPIMKGTFDIYDIIVELLAEVIAVFIIKNIY